MITGHIIAGFPLFFIVPKEFFMDDTSQFVHIFLLSAFVHIFLLSDDCIFEKNVL